MFAYKPFSLSYRSLGSNVHRFLLKKKNAPNVILGAIKSLSFTQTSLHERARILNAKRRSLERLHLCMQAVFTLLPTAVIGCWPIFGTEDLPNGVPGAIKSLSLT